MCTVLLSPGDSPIAVNKYIISIVLENPCGKLAHFLIRHHDMKE